MAAKPKLVYIIHGISVGGAELAMLSALPKLSMHFDLRVFVLGRSSGELLEQIDAYIRQKMVFWHFPAFTFPFYLPIVCLWLVRLNPDIVISSLWRSVLPALVCRWLVGRVKYIVMLHSATFFHGFDRFFTRVGVRHANAVFADSKATKDFAERFVRGETPVCVLSYLTEPTPQRMVKRRYDGRFSFFFMGSLNAVKRVPLAVKTIAWLRKHGIDASLHVYGRAGNDEAAIRSAILEAGLDESVSIHGEIPPTGKGEVYPKHNAYIQLSVNEGMAMSVAEAMQQGMVCVLTPVGEIPNYAIDGVSAIFMETTDGEISEKSLVNLLSILKDSERCGAIASAAHGRFTTAPLFADSLIKAIHQI